MATIFQKLRTLTLGNIHDLLDKAIDLNSLGSIRQHIRDLETARDELSDQAAVTDASVGVIGSKISNLNIQIATTNGNIDLILSDEDDSNDHLATPLEARLMGFESELESLNEELTSTKATAQALNEAASKVSAKHLEMMGHLRRLESLDRTTKAKERASEALKQASVGDTVSVDNVTERLEQRGAVADSKLKRALGNLSDSVDVGVAAVEAKRRIAERRARLNSLKPEQAS